MADTPHYTMFINGEWVDTQTRYEVVAPATGELTATVAFGDIEHVDAAVAAAKAAHEEGTWRRLTPEQRADYLDRMADDMEAKAAQLSALATGENGVTVRTAGAFHIGLGIANLRVFAALARAHQEELPNPLAPEDDGARSVIRKEPIGVCAGIVPFNFPLVLAGWKIGPAAAVHRPRGRRPGRTGHPTERMRSWPLPWPASPTPSSTTCSPGRTSSR